MGWIALDIGAALLGAVGFGWAIFGSATLTRHEPAFQCFTVGLLAAVILSLVRRDRLGAATAFAVGYGLFQFTRQDGGPWFGGLYDLALAGGLVLIGMIFTRLGEQGMRFGRFLIVGPLLGCLMFASAPITMSQIVGLPVGVPRLLTELFLGVLIGDGVGLGLELAELIENRVGADWAEPAELGRGRVE